VFDPRRIAWSCRVAILLAIAGVFGTWRNSGPVSLSGFDGPHNGWLAVIFALLALAGAGAAGRGGWIGVILVVGCSAVIFYTALDNLIDDGDVLGGSSGWGIWLTIVAAALLAIAAGGGAKLRLRRG
jgi:hypothetical protein